MQNILNKLPTPKALHFDSINMKSVLVSDNTEFDYFFQKVACNKLAQTDNNMHCWDKITSVSLV